METIQVLSTDINENTVTDKKRNPLNLFLCKCPRCRKGDMFVDKNPWHLKTTMKMHKECPECKQPLDIEVGFYFGSSYISYALCIALSAATFIAWFVLIGFSLNDNRVFYWLIFNAVFLIAMQPYLMRVSRTGWLAFFVRYDRNWRKNAPKELERTNKTHENNW